MFYVVQGGTTLKKMTTAGALTSLLIPVPVLVDVAKVLRGAVLLNLVALVNSPSENLTVDVLDAVRPLSLRPPGVPVALGVAAGGTLTGTFLVKETYVIKDASGNIIAESD